MSNTTTINTRIALRYDNHATWETQNPVLKAGEMAIDVNNSKVMLKVGDGRHTFNELPYVSGLASDVSSWAKAANAPTYNANSITGLNELIAQNDTDTTYTLKQNPNHGHIIYL